MPALPSTSERSAGRLNSARIGALAGRRQRVEINELLWSFFSGCIFLVLADDGSDGLQFVAGVEIYQFHAHRVAAGFADALRRNAHHLPAHGDEHDLVRS